MVALVAFVLFSFLGTVPINIRVNDWDAAHPPAGWEHVIARWQLIDVFRSSAALLGFVLLLIGLVPGEALTRFAAAPEAADSVMI